MFQFQQFTIHDDRCAMKVGTDGVLLGAWCKMPPTPSAARALDIGTGSGLIAMMLAQRYPQGQIVGVELDADATSQAIENVAASPFASQIVVKQGDIMSEDWREDRVSCNVDGNHKVTSWTAINAVLAVLLVAQLHAIVSTSWYLDGQRLFLAS